MPATPLTLRAPAKINLHLRVFPKAADGFHPIRSWFRTVDLFDELTFELTDEPGRCAGGRMSLWCDAAGVATDESNLICRAWASVADAPRVRATLAKHIPLGGGLGGGSSDAAATLLAADHFTRFKKAWRNAGERFEANATRAATLGSDVPFFLTAASLVLDDAICEGRGEQVTPFHAPRRHAALLLLTGIECPTPAVYRRLDELPPPEEDGWPDFAASSALPAAELLPLLRNDLEPAAFDLRPELGKLRDAAEARLGRPVRMTGSGGTLFTLYDDAAEVGAMIGRLDGLGVSAVVA